MHSDNLGKKIARQTLPNQKNPPAPRFTMEEEWGIEKQAGFCEGDGLRGRNAVGDRSNRLF